MKEGFAIVGAGAFARETLDILEAINAFHPVYEFYGFLVERDYLNHDEICGYEVHAGLNVRGMPYVIAIGDPSVRRRLADQIDGRPGSLVHPSAVLGKRVDYGDGTIICAGSILTTNVELGNHVHVNLGCTIGHDCLLRDYVTLSPGVHLSGRVAVGEGVEIGTGAVVLPDLCIGSGARVGAGAVVTKNVPSGVTVVGVPARVRS